MTQVKNGDTIKVHYTGKLEDGTVFDTSLDRDPLEFTVGEGQIIPGFEEAVIGMNPGESKTTTIPSDQAYGPHYEDMVLQVDHNQFPAHLAPQVGEQFQVRQTDGRTVIVTVTEISPSAVTLDANHPLAGKDLTFYIELVEIV